MRKHEAELLVRGMTWGQIKGILKLARRNIHHDEHWRARSKLNPCLTKGLGFNIFWRGLQNHCDEQIVPERLMFVAANVMYEFGEAAGFRAAKKDKKELPPPSHQDPMKID